MRRIKKKMPMVSIGIFVLLFLMAFISIFLVFWGVMTSFKSVQEYMYSDPLSLFPKKLDFTNYQIVYNNFAIDVLRNGQTYKVGLWSMLYNSFVYAGVGSFIAAFVPFMVAYITAKYSKFVVCKVINAMVIILIGLPIIGTAAPTIQLLNQMRIFNTHLSMILLKAGFLNTYYLIFFASWQGIPDEYRDAASIDGASEFATMILVMFPMMYKMFLTVFLIMFVANWNDYSIPMIYLYDYPVLATGVHYMSHTDKFVDLPDGSRINLNRAPYRMAASMILLLPIMALFIAFNDQLMGNLSMGGLKE